MEGSGLICTLSMAGQLARFLAPEENKEAIPSSMLPNKQWRFSVDQLEKVYQGVMPVR